HQPAGGSRLPAPGRRGHRHRRRRAAGLRRRRPPRHRPGRRRAPARLAGNLAEVERLRPRVRHRHRTRHHGPRRPAPSGPSGHYGRVDPPRLNDRTPAYRYDLDWRARWIAPVEAADVPSRQRPAYQLAGAVRVDGEIVAARLHATAHGLYEAFVNGTRIGDAELTPGWTAYRTRLLVQCYDVTDLL